MTRESLRIVALVVIGVSFFSFGVTIARAPIPSDVRAGLRGLRRQEALTKVAGWPHVEPIIRWLGARFLPLLSQERRASLDRQLTMAGGFLGLVPEELVALSLASGVLALAVGSAVRAALAMGPLTVWLMVGFGFMAPLLWTSSVATERARAITRRLPDAIDLLALAIGAGLDFPAAVRQIIEKSSTASDPLIAELALVLQSLQLGRTRRQALEEFYERAPLDAVREFTAAIIQAELRGHPLADALRIQAEVSRQQRTVRAEETASKAGVAMVGPLVLAFMAILILIVGPIAIRLQTQGL